MTIGMIIAALATCMAAPPYDDCGPAMDAARVNPDTREIVYWMDRLAADPVLAAQFTASVRDDTFRDATR